MFIAADDSQMLSQKGGKLEKYFVNVTLLYWELNLIQNIGLSIMHAVSYIIYKIAEKAITAVRDFKREILLVLIS